MNGHAVKDGDDLVSRVSGTPIGDTVTITVDRDGKRIDSKLVIGDRDEQRASVNPGLAPRAPGTETPEPSQPSGAKFGLRLRPTSDAERSAARIDEGGIVVTTVDPDSFAEEVGLQERDIIVSINRTPVASVDDVRKLQSQLKAGDAVTFAVMRPMVVSGRDGRVNQYSRSYLAGAMPAGK
jgi:serine protease Do